MWPHVQQCQLDIDATYVDAIRVSLCTDGDGGSNGGGNPEDKGQWRNWVEQRLKGMSRSF